MSNVSLPENCVLTPETRLSHANIYKTAPNLNGKQVFSVTLLIPKTTDVSDIRRSIDAAVTMGVQKKWKGYMPPNLQLPLKDGDAYAAQKPDKRQAYVGNWYINCSQNPDFGTPIVLNEQRVRSTDPKEVQSGDYAVVVVEFVPFDNLSQGVAAVPKVIRKTRTGEHFGGGVSEADALAAIGGEADPAIGAALAGGLGSIM